MRRPPLCVLAQELRLSNPSSEINLRNVIAACAAVCVFTISLGEAFPLLSLTMEAWGTGPEIIGLNAAISPVGILLAGILVPSLAHSFGAKRVAIFMAIATGLIFLAYPTFPTLWAWFPLRLLQGLFVGTLFALSEAWILASAGHLRGRVVGIYATCMSATFGVGPVIIGWVGIEGYAAFTIGAVVLFLAIIPISLVSVPADHAEREHVSMLRFLRKAPLLLTAIYVHAIFDGGMLAFLSIYGVRNGMSLEAAALLVTAWSLGNVFFQVPIGWIADRTSKRGTIIACIVGTSICLAAMPFAIDGGWIWPLLLFAGAAGFGIYTVGLAELGDRFSGADLVAGTAAFSSAFGIGALTGAVLCGFAMDVFGPHGLPGSILAVFVGYLVIQFVFRTRRRAATAE
jgi:MFS family permease